MKEKKGKEKRGKAERWKGEDSITLKLIFLWEALILSLSQCFVQEGKESLMKEKKGEVRR